MTTAPSTQLPEDLNTALLAFLEPQERVLWTGRPQIRPSRFTWLMRSLAALLPAALAVALLWGGYRASIDIRLVGLQLGALSQILTFGAALITFIAGLTFVALTALIFFIRANPPRYVYAVTTTRILGFDHDPLDPYSAWWLPLSEVKLEAKVTGPDGKGDVLFPGLNARGWTFEGGAVFSSIPHALAVATLIKSTIDSRPHH